MTLSITTIFFLLLAGFFSGVVNAIAGGGTFISFGALTLAGLPPISANATCSIAQFPGYVTSTLAYWTDIRKNLRGAVLFAVVSAVGALIGSGILLMLDNPSFRAVVPWLLIAATALFAAGPWLKPKQGVNQQPSKGLGAIAQFLTSIYGGFFGAGMGIMMLASLGLTEKTTDYHKLNALKNLLAVVIAAVAILVFTAGGVVDWTAAVVLIPAVAAGGYAGVWVAKRLPQSLVRGVVIAIGIALAIYYFTV
ncbi:sulfite exporter TauE/SafE family protein [Tianweitania sediminis]|uniref:Probable membrane transporter protein n=1 Tax=Tianweitania sediminis TaxID=1502156 RepID=A0A8J7UKI4_9HYPH|nr:sulfite exporter TauE/SafE family protein [Tianweitania sediminis]MBP0441213.1 sulfite exporter TauE/SafE family protein [Tianweitania sediminis]HEV7415332.1 sulfite exporter TauE/SafE family protein [Tianweitania sediminis]